MFWERNLGGTFLEKASPHSRDTISLFLTVSTLLVILMMDRLIRRYGFSINLDAFNTFHGILKQLIAAKVIPVFVLNFEFFRVH